MEEEAEAEAEAVKKRAHISNPKPAKIKNKYHSTLLFTFIIIILALIPLSLFPSHFINQHSFISLLFFAITVCYGLFIRRPIDPILVDTITNNHSYLSSIFDNIGFETVHDPENASVKFYDFNGEPMAVVLPDNLGKPGLYNNLNLPVRSLRSKVVKNCYPKSVEETGTNTGPVRFSDENDKNKKTEIWGLIPINLEKKFEEAVALPSPVPWSSRSSRVEVRNKLKPLSHKKLLSVGVNEFNEMRSKETRLSGRNKVGTVVGNVGFSSLGDFEFDNLNSQSMLVNTKKVAVDRGGSELNENMGQQTSLTQMRALHANEVDIMKAQPKSKQMKVRNEKRNATSPPCLRPSSHDDSGNNDKKLESMMGQMETRGKEGYAQSLSQSESFWSSIFSPINSGFPSPKNTSHLSPIITEDQNPELEDLMKKGCSLSWISTNTPQFGIGSSLEKNLDRTWDITLKTFNKSATIEENREKMKPASPTKSLPRGKSVRTIKTNKSCLVNTRREEKFLGLMDENFEKTKGRNLENISLDESSKSVDHHSDKRQVTSRSCKAHTEKESFGDMETFKANFGEKADSANADNEEVDSDEVDKKADVFIAKFREQIRLQKIDSIKRKR